MSRPEARVFSLSLYFSPLPFFSPLNLDSNATLRRKLTSSHPNYQFLALRHIGKF